MIVRIAIKCDTCDQPHTLRIGLGQENTQAHQFNCRNCSEKISVSIDLDYARAGTRFRSVENCIEIEEVPGAYIVNLEADFLVPESEQGKDFSFFRLQQFHEITKRRELALRFAGKQLRFVADAKELTRPDYAGEFKELKKAWSLARNGHHKLSKNKVTEANSGRHKKQPVDDLADWVFRFASAITRPSYEVTFLSSINAIRDVSSAPEFRRMAEDLALNANIRGENYLDIMRGFFQNFSEFSQTYLLVSEGLIIDDRLKATSIGFDAVRAFYGDCFERFVTLTDILAFANNIAMGRNYDKFERLSLAEYRKLDKANRFGPFSMNVAFINLCAEANPSIRNASHHGSFSFNPTTQVIAYRSGKGGHGPQQHMTYVEYLEKCVRIFMQTMCLLRIELVVASGLGLQPPLS